VFETITTIQQLINKIRDRLFGRSFNILKTLTIEGYCTSSIEQQNSSIPTNPGRYIAVTKLGINQKRGLLDN
jgi:hypothetical protein